MSSSVPRAVLQEIQRLELRLKAKEESKRSSYGSLGRTSAVLAAYLKDTAQSTIFGPHPFLRLLRMKKRKGIRKFNVPLRRA